MKRVNHCLISTNLRLYNRNSVITRNLAVLTWLLLFIPSLLCTQYSPLVARFIIALLTRQYTSSKQSMGPRTRRIFVDFAKIYFLISSVLQIRTVSVFLFFCQNLVKPNKTPSSCLGAGKMFGKRQNWQIFQVAGVILAENVCQVNLISIFKSLFSQKPAKIFDPYVHYTVFRCF